MKKRMGRESKLQPKKRGLKKEKPKRVFHRRITLPEAKAMHKRVSEIGERLYALDAKPKIGKREIGKLVDDFISTSIELTQLISAYRKMGNRSQELRTEVHELYPIPSILYEYLKIMEMDGKIGKELREKIDRFDLEIHTWKGIR